MLEVGGCWSYPSLTDLDLISLFLNVGNMGFPVLYAAQNFGR